MGMILHVILSPKRGVKRQEAHRSLLPLSVVLPPQAKKTLAFSSSSEAVSVSLSLSLL